MNAWRHVSVEQPRRLEDVLVTAHDDVGPSVYMMCLDRQDRWCWSEDGEPTSMRVTHWMELPEPAR